VQSAHGIQIDRLQSGAAFEHIHTGIRETPVDSIAAGRTLFFLKHPVTLIMSEFVTYGLSESPR
jgi:hypothetical protein